MVADTVRATPPPGELASAHCDPLPGSGSPPTLSGHRTGQMDRELVSPKAALKPGWTGRGRMDVMRPCSELDTLGAPSALAPGDPQWDGAPAAHSDWGLPQGVMTHPLLAAFSGSCLLGHLPRKPPAPGLFPESITGGPQTKPSLYLPLGQLWGFCESL